MEVGGLWSEGVCECGISGCEVQVQAVYILSSSVSGWFACTNYHELLTNLFKKYLND